MMLALTLGLLSSWHCAGMCGPLFSLILIADQQKMSFLNFIYYHAGRLFVYGLIGLIPVLLGVTAITAGWQQLIAICAGVFMLLVVWIPKKYFRSINDKLSLSSRSISRNSLKIKSRFKFMGLGIANGILPCGMVYIALAAAIGGAHVLPPYIFMILFGFATLPVFLVMFLIRQSAGGFRFFQLISKKQQMIISAIAVLMILRGMNLGIPYLSPVVKNDPLNQTSCCHVSKH